MQVYIVAGLNLNTDLLLAPPFKKSGILVFLLHWVAWIALHFIAVVPTLLNSTITSWEPFFFNHLFIVTLNFLLFYTVAFFILPRLATLPRRWFWVVAASLVLTILFTYLKFRLQESYNQYLLNKTNMYSKFPRRVSTESLGFFSYRFRTYLQNNVLVNVSVVVVAFAYRLLLLWFQQEKLRKELENQKLQAELSFLKMQVNPHFLFNALNNIYSLSVIENSKKTGDSVMKLSDLMRYMLYEKEDAEHKVSLDKEIRHINSYIDLEKLRHLGDVYINFSIEGEPNGKRIAPLLLFPLIENACKHGVLTESSKPVNINMKITDDQINFCVENYVNSFQKDKAGGIGIPNVQKRLDLLYDHNYKLDVKSLDGKFCVNLGLPL